MALSCYLSGTYCKLPPPPGGGLVGQVGMPGWQTGAGRVSGPGPAAAAERWLGSTCELTDGNEAVASPAKTTNIAKKRSANFMEMAPYQKSVSGRKCSRSGVRAPGVHGVECPAVRGGGEQSETMRRIRRPGGNARAAAGVLNGKALAAAPRSIERCAARGSSKVTPN